MKFLIITRANYPSSSWGNRVRMIAKGLIENGVKVEVLVTHPWPSKENIDISEGFVKYLTSTGEKKESIFSILKQLKTLFLLRKKLNNYKNIDKVLLTGDRWLDSFIVSRFCKKHKIEFLVEVVDEIGRQFDKKKNTVYSTLAILNRKLFNSSLNKIDKLFVLSSYLENKYKSFLPENKIIRSSPTFVNKTDFQFKLSNYNYFEKNNLQIIKNDILITYAGSCERPNGLFFFLKAVCNLILNKKHSDIKIFFIFHIGNIEIIKEQINKLGITNNVIIVPGIDPNFIPSVYNKSDILILPEQGDVVANAGFPGKVGEYLISGKAIITTNFSDLSYYLKNNYNCMMSEISDIESYQHNLEILINNKEKRTDLGANAQITGIKNFDYIEAVKIYIE